MVSFNHQNSSDTGEKHGRRKNKQLTAGADERTPSHPQYFSWVNSTNEGSTEAQTLINLDYFRYLYDTYGMRLEIYAWDAGNLDGSAGTYQLLGKSEKLKKQYPNGYGPIAEAAAKIGTRLGVWCGPDGFGDTEESAKAHRADGIALPRFPLCSVQDRRCMRTARRGASAPVRRDDEGMPQIFSRSRTAQPPPLARNRNALCDHLHSGRVPKHMSTYTWATSSPRRITAHSSQAAATYRSFSASRRITACAYPPASITSRTILFSRRSDAA